MKTLGAMEKYRQAILNRGVLPETPSASDHGPPSASAETPSSGSWLAFRGPVREQGAEGSCASYGTLKVYEMEHLRLTGEQLNTSERFCYNLAKIVDEIPANFIEQQGTTLRAAAKVLRHYGVCDESDWPYFPGDRAHIEIPRFLEMLRKARRRRIAEYRNLLKDGVNNSTLTIIRQALCRRPVVCALLVHNNWFTVGPDGFIAPLGTDRSQRTDAVRLPSSPSPSVSRNSPNERAFPEGAEPHTPRRTWIGGHAVALAFYDDNLTHLGRSGWFGLINSWSEAWGDHGIGYIDYASFVCSLLSTYEIVLDRHHSAMH